MTAASRAHLAEMEIRVCVAWWHIFQGNLSKDAIHTTKIQEKEAKGNFLAAPHSHSLSTISTRATDTFATRKVDFEKCAPCARVKSNQVERALLFHYTNFSADIHNTFRGRHIKTCHSHFAIWERCFNKNQSQRKREHIYISTQRVEQ